MNQVLFRKLVSSFVIVAVVVAMSSCSRLSRVSKPVWKQDLHSEVQALGYRNWIVIADASYPFYNRPGIRTVVAPVETPELIEELKEAISKTQHIKPQFFLSRELQAVGNNQAPGIDQFRNLLNKALIGFEPRMLDEFTLNRLLQGTSSEYAVLVIKTKTTLPYSSVFIELDSGYWDQESEQVLRSKLKNRSLKKLFLKK